MLPVSLLISVNYLILLPHHSQHRPAGTVVCQLVELGGWNMVIFESLVTTVYLLDSPDFGVWLYCYKCSWIVLSGCYCTCCCSIPPSKLHDNVCWVDELPHQQVHVPLHAAVGFHEVFIKKVAVSGILYRLCRFIRVMSWFQNTSYWGAGTWVWILPTDLRAPWL